MMLKLRQESGLFIRVFGPEQDAVSVCPLAFGLVPEDSLQDFDPDRREVKVDERPSRPRYRTCRGRRNGLFRPARCRRCLCGNQRHLDAMSQTQFSDTLKLSLDAMSHCVRAASAGRPGHAGLRLHV